MNSDNGGGGVDKSPITPTHLIATLNLLKFGLFYEQGFKADDHVDLSNRVDVWPQEGHSL